MKRNVFYLLIGVIALAEVFLFWLSVELQTPLLIQAAIIGGILVIYLARRLVREPVADERTELIAEKAALKTLEIFLVIFLAVSLGTVVIGFGRSLRFHPEPPFGPPPGPFPNDIPILGRFGMLQLALLCLMVILYVGFRMYYARKYGEWEKDEE
jgi:uncharacterized membrane protein